MQTDALTEPLLAEQDDEEHGPFENEHAPPALEGADEHKSQSKGRLSSADCPLRILRKALLSWFETTTNREYLQSPISRRRCWKWFWPVFATSLLLSDAAEFTGGSGSWSSCCVDMVLLLITLLVCVRYTLQFTTIRADLVLGVSFLAQYAWWLSQLPSAKDGLVATDAGSLSMTILFFCCLGVHSSISILTLAFFIIPKISFSSQTEDIQESYDVLSLFELIVCSGSAVVLEFCIASLYQDLQAKSACNQQLLDFATDGFGAVQSTTWRLTQVSQKMAETFARSEEELVGRCLEDLIDDRDRGYVRAFLGEAARGSTEAALLVTASSPGWQFEVRLMPYKVDRDGQEVGFCMQLVGEMRATETSPAPAAHRGYKAASAQEGPELAEHIEFDIEGEAVLTCQSSDGEQQQRPEQRGTAPEPKDASRPSRPLGTLSVSSWTISAPSVKEPKKPKKEMVTQATQTGTAETQRRRKPPAPLAAATGNLLRATSSRQPKQPKSRQRAASDSGGRQRRLPNARIEEGRPGLTRYAATPRSTRGNCLTSLAKSFNITGPGCCSKHVGYMAVYDVLVEELNGSCGNLTLNSDWQCPDCLSLNQWQADNDIASDDDSESGGLEQLCMMCGTLVENPVLQASNPTAFRSWSSVEASASSIG